MSVKFYCNVADINTVFLILGCSLVIFIFWMFTVFFSHFWDEYIRLKKKKEARGKR